MEAFGKATLLLALGILITFIPAAVWYCFDDKLAEITNVPALGTIPFWNMYAFCWFLTMLVSSKSVDWDND